MPLILGKLTGSKQLTTSVSMFVHKQGGGGNLGTSYSWSGAFGHVSPCLSALKLA